MNTTEHIYRVEPAAEDTTSYTPGMMLQKYNKQIKEHGTNHDAVIQVMLPELETVWKIQHADATPENVQHWTSAAVSAYGGRTALYLGYPVSPDYL